MPGFGNSLLDSGLTGGSAVKLNSQLVGFDIPFRLINSLYSKG